MSVEGPPVESDDRASSLPTAVPGPGLGRAAGRGVAVAPMAQAPAGLTGPVRGIGGAGPSIMQPMPGMMNMGMMRPSRPGAPNGQQQTPGMMMPPPGAPPGMMP